MTQRSEPGKRSDARRAPSAAKPPATTGIGHDILLALARSKPELVAAAIEASPVNITIADTSSPDMPLAYVNSAFTRTTGYSIDEVIGRNCRFLQGPNTDPAAVDLLRDAIKTETEVEVEFVNYKKDGTAFINALKMAPVHDQHGRLISFVGIQDDITEERERARLDVERQRIEALGQMAGGVAHQLNNLLQPIVTLTALHRPDMPADHMGPDFDTVLESARQAAGVVEDVLAFSRRKEPTFEILSVAETVLKNVEFIRTLLPKSIFVQVSIKPEINNVYANIDATQFSQALANLLINSSQAMDEAGRIHVEVTVDDGHWIHVSIVDEGPGIPQEIRSRVLEPFFSTRLEKGGTGLGLSVVYGIVNRHGGKISITGAGNERRGPGCCITLSLPAIQGPKP